MLIEFRTESTLQPGRCNGMIPPEGVMVSARNNVDPRRFLVPYVNENNSFLLTHQDLTGSHAREDVDP
jgi:hypothetical protein